MKIWDPTVVLWVHIELIDEDDRTNIFFFHLLIECHFFFHFNKLYHPGGISDEISAKSRFLVLSSGLKF
jgi:hypothetical protein